MTGCLQCHIPGSPAFDICDIQGRRYQVLEHAYQIHDDSFRAFDQDEEKRKHNEESTHNTDITYDSQVELEGESDEAQRVNAVRDPGAPTAKEVAEHEITHLPHRSWCAACVASRSRERPHKRIENREKQVCPLSYSTTASWAVTMMLKQRPFW